ncbi:uncharacterized protein RCC_06828 [Ramularia collo-cygni]|uniref:Uncharacterized protein n=1 Tax=Ramularia collo-cygni TaxID=112498 RepID=A0A2D3V877_9PEZI|nr:uncharacterized protein RCC_06828 [Ramularia collo-cygni]CZT20967.1 uncharacterized protein RCC_06828 [Ramularia collo-cygni]
MNRYKTGGPSKASVTTLCQKCLKRGHYSYECTASKDDRPYVSRPSRSQQLLNPKLAPKLSAVLPEPKPASRKIASDAEVAPRDTSRSRKRSIDLDGPSAGKRMRSISSHSSDSVSTISTNRSKSRSRSRSPDQPSRRQRSISPRRKRSRDGERSLRKSHDPESRRSRSPEPDRRPSQNRQSNRQRSYSPARSRQAATSTEWQRSPNVGAGHTAKVTSATRERSLSPYSQRIALTKARNQT